MTFRPWSQGEDLEIIRLHKGGLKPGAIGLVIGRHVKAVSNRMVVLRKDGRLPGFTAREPETVTLTPAIVLNGDGALVRDCNDEGGFPRAVSLDGRTFWIKPDGTQWSHTPLSSRRRAA